MKRVADKVLRRDWEEKDLEPFRKWNSGRHRWMDFDGPYYPPPKPDELAELLQDYQSKIEAVAWENPRLRLVIAEAETDALIGTVSWYW